LTQIIIAQTCHCHPFRSLMVHLIRESVITSDLFSFTSVLLTAGCIRALLQYKQNSVSSWPLPTLNESASLQDYYRRRNSHRMVAWVSGSRVRKETIINIGCSPVSLPSPRRPDTQATVWVYASPSMQGHAKRKTIII